MCQVLPSYSSARFRDTLSLRSFLTRLEIENLLSARCGSGFVLELRYQRGDSVRSRWLIMLSEACDKCFNSVLVISISLDLIVVRIQITEGNATCICPNIFTVQRTKLCRSELPANDAMRRYNSPDPSFFPTFLLAICS
ncbi:hypothetical protein EVAR_33890_1 [Eumeta japonica]|uniref:Uncharacterized protein n=1 Tax=Eumeta variegata TaxID=151549 RepID=A0A4C1WLF9_EUMVA|nr:hypothetical protein EVAR_33890_1 [Eumeta japonica]